MLSKPFFASCINLSIIQLFERNVSVFQILNRINFYQINLFSNRELLIYSALVTLLFHIQELYLKLSTSCADQNCLNTEIQKFEEKFQNVRNNILPTHMTFLHQSITSRIFSFFQYAGLSIIELKEIKEQGCNHFNYAHASAFIFSQALAYELASVQQAIIELDEEANFDINPNGVELRPMIYCCGIAPEDSLLYEYVKNYPQPLTLKESYNYYGEDNRLDLKIKEPIEAKRFK